jgi:hypothetical protein
MTRMRAVLMQSWVMMHWKEKGGGHMMTPGWKCRRKKKGRLFMSMWG